MLKIRPFEWSDAESIHRLHKEQEMANLMGDEPAKDLENTIHVLSGMVANDAILLVAESGGRFAGFLNIDSKKGTQAHCGSIGVAVDKEFWGRGVGSKLVKEGIKLARKMKLKKLEYRTVEHNDRSINLAKGLDFKLAGRLKRHVSMNKKYYDLLIFEKLLD